MLVGDSEWKEAEWEGGGAERGPDVEGKGLATVSSG